MRAIVPRKSARLVFILTAFAFGMACGSSGKSAVQSQTDDFSAFFTAYEKGDTAAALAALPQALREASPYTAATVSLPPFNRDEPLYTKLAADLDAAAPVPAAAASEAAVYYSLGVLAYRKGEWETARRRFLLALQRDPGRRMAHIYLARTYRKLEEAALKEAKEGEDPGAVLLAKVGIGSSDQHIEMAQQILDRDGRESPPALSVTFQYDLGAVKNFKAAWTTASGNAMIQRQSAADEEGSCRIELCGPGRIVLDEKSFGPIQTIFWDGLDAQGKPVGGRNDLVTFSVNRELLSLTPGGQVIIYDPAGIKIFSAAVPPLGSVAPQ
jgi:tetratricopeptide (TPR) repeat protein